MDGLRDKFGEDAEENGGIAAEGRDDDPIWGENGEGGTDAPRDRLGDEVEEAGEW
jgi:hypothetical protein